MHGGGGGSDRGLAITMTCRSLCLNKEIDVNDECLNVVSSVFQSFASEKLRESWPKMAKVL